MPRKDWEITGLGNSAGSEVATRDGGQVSVAQPTPEGAAIMIVLGLILLIIGFLANISILWTIGIILLVVGAVLMLVGRTGRKVGGRSHWF